MKANKIKFYVILVLIIITSVMIVQTIRKPMPSQITGVQSLDSETPSQQPSTGRGMSGITGMAVVHPKATQQINNCVGSFAAQAGWSAGDIIELTQDISILPLAPAECLIIDLANITLDCQGFRIIGSDNSNGVLVNVSNPIPVPAAFTRQTIIRNCHFFNFSNTSLIDNGRAIYLKSRINYTLIANNTFNRTRGILANYTNTLTIANNTFVNYTFSSITPAIDAQIQLIGVLAYQSNITTIDNNTFEGINSALNKPNAIYARYVNNLNIWNNTIQSSNLVEIQGANIFDIAGNSLSRTDIETIANKNTVNGTVRNNQYIDTNTNVMLTALAGRISNLSFSEHNNVDFSLETVAGTMDDIRVENNTFSGAMQIDFRDGSTYDLRIRNNVFTRPVRGTTINVGELILVTDNEFRHGSMYSIIVSGDNTTVQNNTFTNITGRGIIVEANNATIRNNSFVNFTGIAIIVGDESWPPAAVVGNTTVANNTINLFVQNTNQTTLHVAMSNTTNYNLPPIPSAGTGIFILPYTNFTNITLNIITETNTQNLNAETYGIYGATSTGNATGNLYIFGNNIQQVKNGIKLRGCLTTRVLLNTITGTTKNGITTDDCVGTRIRHNTITGGDPTLVTFKNGMEIFKSYSDLLQNNTITQWHTGIYFYNATNVTSNLNDINETTIGLLSFFSDGNVIRNDTINGTTAIKFLMTNNTIINDTTILGNENGIMFSQSFFNNMSSNDFTASLPLIFDHNSANNNLTGNTFTCIGGVAADPFVINDLFATNNNGTGSTFVNCAVQINRNYASANSIT